MINIIGHIKQLFVKYPYLTIGLFVSVFFIVCAYVLPIQFEENDDITMLLLASGKYSGTPEAHLMYINYLYGLFLFLWYKSFPAIEWYSIWFSLLHIISITLILKEILWRKCHALVKYSVSFIILIFEIFFVVNFQFTTTATLTTMAGIVLVLSNERKKSIYFGLFFIVIGGLIREESALMSLILSSPIFIFLLLQKNKKAIVLIYAVLLIVICHAFNHFAYKYTSWSYFNDFRVIKAHIIDNNNSLKYFETIKDQSETDDFMLFMSSIFDSKILDNNKLDAILNRINAKNSRSIFLEMVSIFKSFIIGNFNNYLPPILSILLFILVFLISSHQKYHQISLILVFILFGLLLCYIPVFRTLKYRAFISSLFILFVLTVIHYNINKNLLAIIVFCITLYFSNYLFRMIKNSLKYNSKKHELFISQYNMITKYNGIIVPFGGSYLIECYSPFKVSQKWESQKIFSFALVGSPLNNGICNNHVDFVNGPALFMDKGSVEPISALLIQSIKAHYNINAKYKIVEQDSLSAIVQFYK